MEERLQKIISAAGITSRRAAEQLILEGRVRVNGKVVVELGTRADAAKDHIKVDGKLINPRQPRTYIMLNKPAGYVTTLSDPEGRPTVLELLKGLKIRVYPVGRLDYNTEGLLLLTNDGDFAHRITHPRHELPKTYRVKVKGVLEDRQITELEEGIYLDDGRTAPAKLRKLGKEEVNSWLEITIHEGRKRQVRRMFDRVGHSVIKLKRVKVGPLMLGDLGEGVYRHLTAEEIEAFKSEDTERIPELKPALQRRQPVPERKQRSESRFARKPGKRQTEDKVQRRRRTVPGQREGSARKSFTARVNGRDATGRGTGSAQNRTAGYQDRKRTAGGKSLRPGGRQRSANAAPFKKSASVLRGSGSKAKTSRRDPRRV
ncbi:MAG TPA: pseudouridine synthase [Nitrospirota bacterium]|nr:pseudouridine synthase [Nitrospirota bacterium]